MLFVTPGLLNYNYHVNTNEGGTKDCEEFLAGNRDMGRQK